MRHGSTQELIEPMENQDYGETADVNYDEQQQWSSPAKAGLGSNMMSRRKLMTEKKQSKAKANISIFNTDIKINPGLEKLIRDSSMEGGGDPKAMTTKKPVTQIRAGYGSLEHEFVVDDTSPLRVTTDKKSLKPRPLRLPPVSAKKNASHQLRLNMDHSNDEHSMLHTPL